MDIPILIICYNNYRYVKNTLDQIQRINKDYYKNIQIVNNNSTCKDTINFLKNVDVKVINNDSNTGPWILPWCNIHIYNSLPVKYIVTDPDLEFNKNIPTNFIEILSELSDKYEVSKIGFALDISDFNEMYQMNYTDNKTLYDWEKQYWIRSIIDYKYELYYATIDTTFSLLNKRYFNDNNIRIADNFTAKHLPWYRKNKIYNIYDNYMVNMNSTNISSNSKKILKDIETNYLKINRNNEFFLIENNENNPNLSFWKNTYEKWENNTFQIFDEYLSKDKIFIDIGGWIGTTSMYGSRKSKHVYCIEADRKSVDDLLINMRNNCDDNYTLINKAIYHIDDLKIKFGKNKFISGSTMNNSTSQIYTTNDESDEFYLIETITLEGIIKKYQIDPTEISLIKVDIEGGEENILDDLFKIYAQYKIPMWISFHYTWWNDKNLDRFDISLDIKNIIKNDPFTSILFH
jgi:FkbM family methyltransferase